MNKEKSIYELNKEYKKDKDLFNYLMNRYNKKQLTMLVIESFKEIKNLKGE